MIPMTTAGATRADGAGVRETVGDCVPPGPVGATVLVGVRVGDSNFDGVGEAPKENVLVGVTVGDEVGVCDKLGVELADGSWKDTRMFAPFAATFVFVFRRNRSDGTENVVTGAMDPPWKVCKRSPDTPSKISMLSPTDTTKEKNSTTKTPLQPAKMVISQSGSYAR